MNMESTQLVLTTVTLIFNLKELKFISTKLLVVVMSLELCSWTWNQEQWIQSEQVLSVNFSDRTISSSDNPALVTIGPRVIILKELN
jgi:hypothetical protein